MLLACRQYLDWLSVAQRKCQATLAYALLAVVTGTCSWMALSLGAATLPLLAPHLLHSSQATIQCLIYASQPILFFYTWRNMPTNNTSHSPQGTDDRPIGGGATGSLNPLDAANSTSPASHPGFYWEQQKRHFCQIHALNALLGRRALDGAQVLQRAIDIDKAERRQWGNFMFTANGDFTTGLLNYILRELTMPMAFLHKTSISSIHRGASKSDILKMIPPGLTGFILQWNGPIHTTGTTRHNSDEGEDYGHSVCIRLWPTNNTWYLIDSECT
jgi:hypothetical protein